MVLPSPLRVGELGRSWPIILWCDLGVVKAAAPVPVPSEEQTQDEDDK